jgi:branched-subunit amino acid transport protein
MSPETFAVIVGMALAVYVPKALPLIAVSEGLTDRLRPWLKYVAPAVLGALVAPNIVSPWAASWWSQIPFAVAFIAALATRRMLPALAAGLATLLVVALLKP